MKHKDLLRKIYDHCIYKTWEDNMFSSNLVNTQKHHCYKTLKNLGFRVIPFVVDTLKIGDGGWTEMLLMCDYYNEDYYRNSKYSFEKSREWWIRCYYKDLRKQKLKRIL